MTDSNPDIATDPATEAIRTDTATGNAAPARDPATLPPAARRALAEAEQRRAEAAAAPKLPREIAGRGGAEPARYGDWEVKGIAVDF
ncbi:DUF1674 domain-containing protein [Methylobrevis pamukkalensis]|uniref:DUF1674 domain-containing protein n=1 Tax=Methylobrevis pamukkalensis TaxID=1439726 RepID=A0A1E3H6Z6_9HYPH|nr:DUF1674 domain-containing protein [Methylobrevis pamukkalensis]ODN72074.1 hypothetical protein A6302_00589 [Methylobrevis pamukkalensis]